MLVTRVSSHPCPRSTATIDPCSHLAPAGSHISTARVQRILHSVPEAVLKQDMNTAFRKVDALRAELTTTAADIWSPSSHTCAWAAEQVLSVSLLAATATMASLSIARAFGCRADAHQALVFVCTQYGVPSSTQQQLMTCFVAPGGLGGGPEHGFVAAGFEMFSIACACAERYCSAGTAPGEGIGAAHTLVVNSQGCAHVCAPGSC